MSKKVKSGFLFADPSFFSGAARALDLYGTFDEYNVSRSPAEADARAIASDWIVTGDDLQHAMDECQSEEEEAA